MLFNICKIISSDLLDFAKILCGLLLLTSLLLVCVAIGTLISYAIIFDNTSGLHFFYEIMGLQSAGLIEEVRKPLALFNWFVLIGLPVFLLAGPIKNYVDGLLSRAKSLNPAPSNSDDSAQGGSSILTSVANL